MQFPVNRVRFLHQLISAVSRDLSVPPVFVNAQRVVDESEPERTRLFLAFFARAALKRWQAQPQEEEGAQEEEEDEEDEEEEEEEQQQQQQL